MEGKKIVFIGGGNMTETMLQGLVHRKEDIYVYNARPARGEYLRQQFGIKSVATPEEGGALADLLILAVRADDALRYTEHLKASLKEGCIFISICAEVEMEKFQNILGKDCKLVRTVPNTLTDTGSGYSALCFGDRLSPEDEQEVTALFQAIGKTMVIKESLFSAFSAFSGVGPAYFYYVISALLDAGVRGGFSREEARALAVENMIGSGIRLEHEPETHPRTFIDRMTSPAGLTIEAVCSMEKNGMAGILQDAVKAAFRQE